MIKGVSSILYGDTSYHRVVGYPSTFNKKRFPDRNYSLIASESAIHAMISLHLIINVLDVDRVLSLFASYVSKEILKYLQCLGSYKCVCCCLYNAYAFPPSAGLLSSLKFELLHYSLSGGNHVLKIRCLTFQEQEAETLVPIVTFFMRGFIKRPTSVYPICKWRILGTPSLSVTWVVSFPQLSGDVNSSLKSDLLKESWNDYYSDCHWRERRVSSPSYMDHLLRVTGGFSLTKKIRCFRRKRDEDMDDVVFDKYSDKDSKDYSLPILPVVLISSSLILLLSIFCFVFFIFPMIKKYLFYCVCITEHESQMRNNVYHIVSLKTAV